MTMNPGAGRQLVPTHDERLEWDGVPLVRSVPEGWDGAVAVVLAHGAGQDMDSPFMTFFHEGIAGFGCAAVRFNFPYMAEGRRAPDPKKKLVANCGEVVRRAAAELAPELLIAGGKSMGGRIASYVAAENPEVGALLFLGYPLHPAGQPDRLRDAHLYELARPMLFVNGTRDTLAVHSLLAGVIEKLGERATVHWVEGGDHSFRSGAGSEERREKALAAIGAWISRIRAEKGVRKSE